MKRSPKWPEDLSELSRSDVLHLAQELQVYKNELEAQNEELRTTYDKLERARDHYVELFNAAPIGQLLVDETTTVVRANETFGKMTGLTLERVEGASLGELLVDEDAAIFRSRFRAFFKEPEKKVLQLRFDLGPKKAFDAHIEGRKVDDVLAAAGNKEQRRILLLSVVDISAEKEAERAIRRSENFLSTTLASLLDAVIVIDPQGHITRLNAIAEELLDYRLEEVRNQQLSSCVDLKGNKSAIVDAVEQVMTAGGSFSSNETISVEIKDSVRHFDLNVAPIARGDEDLQGYVIVLRDVTRMSQTLAKLDSEKQRFRALSRQFQTLLDTIPDRLALHSPDLELLWVNATATDSLGLEAKEVVGHPCYKLFKDREEKCTECPVITAFETGKTESGIIIDRYNRIYDLRAAPITDELGNVVNVIEIARDVTENRSLEAQLQQAQKMEILGRLAGGIAHDFNNVLTGITGNISLALMDLEEDHPAKAAVDEVSNAADHASNLVQQLLTFSRKQSGKKQRLDLNRLIISMWSMLSRIIGEDISLGTELDDTLWTTELVSTHFEQIVINLAVNSRDAMPRGGKLLIATTNFEPDAQFERLHPQSRASRYVRLTITDNGVGMDAVTRLHIFEPFFTTKPLGRGTGLGLSMVYGLVTQNNGLIEVNSQEGEGTSFTLYFPALSEKPDATSEKRPSPSPPEGDGVVLIVEDENSVRNLATNILRRLGYEVFKAENGVEALNIIEERGGDVDLVISDVVMPQMNGPELADVLNERYPDIEFVFMSGYNEKVISRYGVVSDGVNFIKKPFTTSSLARLVSSLLSKKEKTDLGSKPIT